MVETEEKGRLEIEAFEFSRPIYSSEKKRIGMARLTLSAQRVREISGRIGGFLLLSCLK